MKIFIAAILLFLFACNDSPKVAIDTDGDSVTHGYKPYVTPGYRSIKAIDSFIKSNGSEIGKNNALKIKYEAFFTKDISPAIFTGGLYEDLPFKLTATTVSDGKTYGIFVFTDDMHYVKQQCIINDKLISSLKEDSTYFIKTKPYKIEEGTHFEGETGAIELPTIHANLISFHPTF